MRVPPAYASSTTPGSHVAVPVFWICQLISKRSLILNLEPFLKDWPSTLQSSSGRGGPAGVTVTVTPGVAVADGVTGEGAGVKVSDGAGVMDGIGVAVPAGARRGALHASSSMAC